MDVARRKRKGVAGCPWGEVGATRARGAGAHLFHRDMVRVGPQNQEKVEEEK